MGQTQPFLFIFVIFSTNLTINYKSVDGVLGTQAQGGRMVGADKSTELWRHPYGNFLVCCNNAKCLSFRTVETKYVEFGKMLKLEASFGDQNPWKICNWWMKPHPNSPDAEKDPDQKHRMFHRTRPE